MQLTSAAIHPGESIPTKFTCKGENVSPELSWSDAPANTKSFVLVLHDPDAPRDGGFTHWVVFDIPAGTGHLEENFPKEQEIAGQGRQATNDGGKLGYMGPCPPSGTHRYFFRLYALGNEIGLRPEVPCIEVLEKLNSSEVLDKAELTGTFSAGAEKAA